MNGAGKQNIPRVHRRSHRHFCPKIFSFNFVAKLLQLQPPMQNICGISCFWFKFIPIKGTTEKKKNYYNCLFYNVAWNVMQKILKNDFQIIPNNLWNCVFCSFGFQYGSIKTVIYILKKTAYFHRSSQWSPTRDKRDKPT